MKPISLVWAAMAAFFILRTQNAQAAFMPNNYSTSGAEILPNMLDEGEAITIDPLEDLQMSSHFTLAEFTASTTAARKQIDNSLPEDLMGNAMETLNMMETIRQYLSNTIGHDVPIKISSGYRSPQLNAAIGGSIGSDHQQARAVDWTAPSFGTPSEIAKALAPYVNELGIGQLINEFPGVNGWVHTSTKTPVLAINRVITITAQGTVPGILEA
jgi:hypothetical protein